MSLKSDSIKAAQTGSMPAAQTAAQAAVTSPLSGPAGAQAPSAASAPAAVASALPEPTPAEIARGLAGAWDTASMHIFSSWTMGDLYRAIAGEPHDHVVAEQRTRAGCGGCKAVEEYVLEIKARREAAKQTAQLQNDLDRLLGINTENEEKLP